MKRLIDVWGDSVWINKDQICYVERKSGERHYRIYFTNGLTRDFTQDEIKKLNKEEDQ